MSITQLRDPAPAAAPAAGSLAGLLEGVRAGLAAASQVSVDSCGTAELAVCIEQLASVESAANALRWALSAEADARAAALDPVVGDASSGTDAWLASLTGTTKASQAAGLRIARLLDSKYDATKEAFAAGRVRADQVRVIVNAAEQAPTRATREQVTAAEEWLLGKATGDTHPRRRAMNATRLRQAARRMFSSIDVNLAAEHEFAMLTGEGQHAARETYLALHDDGDGTWSGRFRIPELHGNLLNTVLGHLTAPRRLTRDRAGDATVDASAPGPRSYPEVAGAALCELIEHLPTGGHTSNPATILITLDYDTLLSGVGSAGLDTGIRIDAGDARRLACEAGLVPAVLGGDSVPLDLGRTRRLHTMNHRRALSLIFDTCAISGCERPFAWTEIHHPHAWSKGGETTLANALPLCAHHHRIAHDPAWELRRHADGEYTFHRVGRPGRQVGQAHRQPDPHPPPTLATSGAPPPTRAGP